MRRTTAVSAMVAAVVTGTGWSQAALADDTVVVAGTTFPTSSTYLTYFGCADLYHADTRGPEVVTYLDAAAPAGRRAADLRMPGAGTASGPVSLVGSVAAATSALSVKAPAGSSGVAWVWYAAGDLDPGQVWAGRADLQAGAGGWQRVTPSQATYAWTRYDASSGTVVDQPGSATIADFTAVHGDGPGYLLAGFGCDGHDFSVDAISVGAPGSVRTFDLEGLPVTTSIAASALRAEAGQQVTLTGATVDARQRVLGAPLVLEQRPVGAEAFTPVGPPVSAGPDGRPSIAVTPDRTTDYRWFHPESSYADAGYSSTLRVIVPGTMTR